MKLAIVALLEAKPGKENELAELLTGARALAVEENVHPHLVRVADRAAQLRDLRHLR